MVTATGSSGIAVPLIMTAVAAAASVPASSIETKALCMISSMNRSRLPVIPENIVGFIKGVWEMIVGFVKEHSFGGQTQSLTNGRAVRLGLNKTCELIWVIVPHHCPSRN